MKIAAKPRTSPHRKHLKKQNRAQLAIAASGAVAALTSFTIYAQAANTGDVFKTTATDLSVGTNYTTTITPTSATTTDVQFSGSYGTTTFSGNGTALSFGTLNDIDTTQSLIVTDGNAMAASISLNTASNSTSGSASSDILYVKSGANLTLQSGVGVLTLNAVVSGNFDDAGNLTISAPVNITAGQTITFTGGGNTSISGNFAATTGALVISSGSTVLSGINLYTGATSVDGGVLTLDFSSAASPTTALNIIKSTNTVNLGGGAIVIKGGGSGATNGQTLGTTALTADTFSTITGNANNATALNIALGTMTRNIQSAFDVTLPSAGTVTTGSTTLVANGIFVSAASNGTAFATANGGATWLANFAGTLSAYSGYSSGTGNYTTANNIDVTSGDSVSGVTVNSLRFNVSNDGLTLVGTNILNTGGILITPAGAGSTITGGTIESAGGKELYIADFSSGNISSVLANSSGGASAVTLSGTGVTTLSGVNTYTGTTAIDSGTVYAGIAQNGTTSGTFGSQNNAFVLAPVATLNLNGFAVGVGGATINSGAIITSTAGGTLTVGNNNAALTGAESAFAITGNASLTINGTGTWNSNPSFTSTSTGNLTFQNTNTDRANNLATNLGSSMSLVLNGNGQIQNTATVSLGAGNAIVINGLGNTWNAQNNGGNALTTNGAWIGSGTVTISNGFNTPTLVFAGNMTRFAGTIVAAWNSTGTLNFTNGTSIGMGSGILDLQTGANGTIVQYTGGGNVTVPFGDLNTAGNSGNASLIAVRNGTNNTTANFQVGSLASNSTYAGQITNGTGTAQASALTKVGSGAWTLTGNNTYTAGTTISAGTLFANNPTSSLGTGIVNVNGGMLAGNGTVANGSNPLTVNAGGSIGAGGNATANGILNSGNQAWSGNGTYAWKLSSTIGTGGVSPKTGASGNLSGGSGAEGTNWDLLNISGTLNLSNLSNASSATQFTIAPSGNITGGATTYSWVIAQTSGNNTITLPTAGNYTVGQDMTNGGSSGAFVLNTSGLTDNTSGGSPSASQFSLEAVVLGGHEDLVLDYSGTPEPSAAILVLGGAVPMLLARRRRRGEIVNSEF